MLAACNAPGSQPDAEATGGIVTYTIEVTTQGGMALSNVSVATYTDGTLGELVSVGKTDETGRITFTDTASDSYVAVLSGIPEGYRVEAYYALTGESTQIALAAELAPVEDLTGVTYDLGAGIGDFSVTAPDGTVYTLSELLAEKEAVALNFWYVECQPCRMEFSYLQEAYEQYGDQIAVLALNPVNADDTSIAAFQSDMGITFPMAKCDPAWENAMQLTAYPTTVIIDRYGTIRAIHRGTIPDTQSFVDLFVDFIEN